MVPLLHCNTLSRKMFWGIEASLVIFTCTQNEQKFSPSKFSVLLLFPSCVNIGFPIHYYRDVICICWTGWVQWTSVLHYWNHTTMQGSEQHKQQQPKFKAPSWLFKCFQDHPSWSYLSWWPFTFLQAGHVNIVCHYGFVYRISYPFHALSVIAQVVDS